jgi:co-chaperonin GroES (HSP10)
MTYDRNRDPILDLTKGMSLPTGPPKPKVDIHPRDGWVLLRKHSLLPADAKLVLVEGETKASYNACKVVAVGPGSRMEDGRRWETTIKPGDIVMIASGPEVPLMGFPWDDDLVMTEESYIVAVIVDKQVM